MTIRKALISVWDKTGVADFARGLVENGIEIYSTGGTSKVLSEAGIKVTPLEELTGFTELIGGRVKTLHPKVFAGILARRDLDEHIKSIAEIGIPAFDIVAVNLYPFEDTLKRTNNQSELLEMIDIGGVALLRAAAKNFPAVVVISDPDDYHTVVTELDETGDIAEPTRKELAMKAFRRTSYYDAVISGALCEKQFPERYMLPLILKSELRYGENPHQDAALYVDSLSDCGVARAEKLWGKDLSYNNILDLDAVLNALQEFPDEIASVVVKHLSPCGIARGGDLLEAYEGALAGDPLSAFGGIVGFTRPVDVPTAEKMSEHFFECVLAPDYEPEALEILKKKKNLRLMKMPTTPPKRTQKYIRGIQGGALVQTWDPPGHESAKWEIVSERKPTEAEENALKFAWRAIRSIKSNSVLIAGENAVFGIGGGLPSRVDSAKLAITKAGDKASGAVAASDAFFPFPDGIEVLAEAGVTAVVQPGGSIRDDKVTARANELGIAMVHTGTRHFRH